MLWVFLQIYKNIFNNVSPSGFFIITAVPRSLTSVNSVDSVGGLRSLTICADLCNLWENIDIPTESTEFTESSCREEPSADCCYLSGFAE